MAELHLCYIMFHSPFGDVYKRQARDSLNDCLITLTVAAATVIAVSTGEIGRAHV